MIAITFALPNESSDFVKRLGQRECPHREVVRILHTGVGTKTTRRRLNDLLSQERPRFLISTGFAGATNATLKVGDVLLAENFGDQSLKRGLENFVSGRLATAPEVIDSAQERAAIARTQNASAIDMETELIAQICADKSVPMISLRAISDTPTARFGIPMKVLFDVEQQRVPIARLLFYLFRHPSAVGKLMILARQVGIARRALAVELERVLRVKGAL